MPHTFVEVNLIGTHRTVWFVHSAQGLLLGPFRSRPEAEGCCRSPAMNDLIVAGRIPRGESLPRFARFAEAPVSGAAIWEMTFESGQSLFFNVVKNGPVCGTMSSIQRAAAYLRALHSRARLWLS